MAPSKTPIPKGFRTVTPTITVRNAHEAVEFYKKALGAEEISRHLSPDGKITHAELKIGDSIIFVADESPAMGNKSPQTLGGTSGSLYLYVEDADKAFQRAVNAGGKATMPVSDMFWGDRFGHLVDPYGQEWGIATHKEDFTEQEMSLRAKEFYAQMGQANRKSA